MSTVPQDPENETENQRLITEEASIHASRRRWTRHLGAVGRWTRSNLLLVATFLSVVVGIILGLSIHQADPGRAWIAVLSLPGELFLRMLKMLILPLIIFSLMAGLGSLDTKVAGSLGWRTVAYYLTTTVVAAVLGLVLVMIIRPGERWRVEKPCDNSSLSVGGNNLETLDSVLDLLRPTSISLSWSVSSGRVASWEVVWRPTDRGTESTSGPLSGTTYTIHQLDPSTIYTLTVSATNVAGTTDSTPILFSTGASNASSSSSESESGATIGGVVGAVLIIAAATLVLNVVIALLLRRQRGNYSTSAKRRSEMVDAPGSAATVLELSKISDEAYASPFQTTSNEAYNVVRGTGRTAEVEYEVPQNLPPTTSSSRPAAGDHFYEPV